MEYKMVRKLLAFSQVGIMDHCEDEEIKELLISYIDELYELLDFLEETEEEVQGVYDMRENGTIEDCMTLSPEDYYSGNW